MTTSGDILALTVEKPAAGGAMIARLDGRVVLVAGAIPGERVRARVHRVGKGVAYATTVEVEEASPDRREPFCDPQCGGLLYNHIAYPRQLAIKGEVIADAFKRIGRLDLPGPVEVAGSREDGYRMRARLHVRGHRVGFFREGTHDLCDVRATRQLLPETCDVLDRLAAAIRSLGGGDAVREIEVSENVAGTERVVHLQTSQPLDERLVAKLTAIDGLTPGPYVTDTLAIGEDTITLRRHVLSFFQGNRYLLRDLVTHVVERVPIGGTLLDLYAGSGVFAVAAAVARGAFGLAVEGDGYAAHDLHENASPVVRQITTMRGAVEGLASGVLRAPRLLEAAPGRPIVETVIVDPPRTGISREAIEVVLKTLAPHLIYVSCDVATLARDARKIVDAGYAITRVDGFDLFPNTPHVETVVVFNRK
jgi:23S rRNA (uracil1939-C5)-methyltransferase